MYNLGLMKLKTLRTYIMANPISRFIRISIFIAIILQIFILKKTVVLAYI